MIISNGILTLRRPNIGDLPAVMQYRQEFLDANSSMDGCSNLRRFADPKDWLAWTIRAEAGQVENWVPDIQLLCLRQQDQHLIGMVDIRYPLNEMCLKLYGGIGYSIRPSQRRKGYATMQLALAKEACRELGMPRLLVSCHKENTASAKVIRKNGGILENETVDQRNGQILQRYWIDLSQ